MKWYSKFKNSRGQKFIIHHDEAVGYYLCLYEDDECFKMDIEMEGCRNRQDEYLQDTLEIAQEQAWDEFGIPLQSWKMIKNEVDE